MASFGIITVGDEPNPLKLHFTSRKVFESALAKLMAADVKIVDDFWGYRVCPSADEALAHSKLFLG